MVARKRRAPQNMRGDESRNEEPSSKSVEKSIQSDESGLDGEPPTEGDAVNASVIVMRSDEEGFASDGSDANSIEIEEPAPDEAGYTADAEDGDGKGEDADDAEDEEKDNMEESGVDTEEIESDEEDREEVAPSPVNIPDSATENDATAVEHDFESEGNEQAEPSENVDTEPGNGGNEQMSNEDDTREETDVADGENSEVENQAGAENNGGYAAAQDVPDGLDEGEMSNANSDTRDGELLLDEKSADEGDAEPTEAGSEDAAEMANGHAVNENVEVVDAPSPVEAGYNDVMTDATEERRSEGEEFPVGDAEPVESVEAGDDHSDVEDDTDMGDAQNTVGDEHSEIEDREEDTSEAVEHIDEIVADEREAESDDDSGDENDVQANGHEEYDDDVNEVKEQEEKAEVIEIASHDEERDGEKDRDNMGDETNAAGGNSANQEEEDEVAEEESGQEEIAEAGDRQERGFEEESEQNEEDEEDSDDDINTHSYELVPSKPAASSSFPESAKTSNDTTTKERIKRKRKEAEKKSSKDGVIYLPRIPPGLDVTALRSLLSRTTQVKRIWLRPETGEQRRRRQSLGGSRRKQRFRDGWVEVSSSKEAKRIVGLLNGQPMLSGKRRGRWADDLWCLKYLKGFAWTDLTNEVFGGRERVLRVRERVMDGRRVKEWVEGRGKGQGIKVRRFRQKRGIEDVDEARAKQAAENVDSEIDGARGGAAVDEELVGMLFKKRRT